MHIYTSRQCYCQVPLAQTQLHSFVFAAEMVSWKYWWQGRGSGLKRAFLQNLVSSAWGMFSLTPAGEAQVLKRPSAIGLSLVPGDVSVWPLLLKTWPDTRDRRASSAVSIRCLSLFTLLRVFHTQVSFLFKLCIYYILGMVCVLSWCENIIVVLDRQFLIIVTNSQRTEMQVCKYCI